MADKVAIAQPKTISLELRLSLIILMRESSRKVAAKMASTSGCKSNPYCLRQNQRATAMANSQSLIVVLGFGRGIRMVFG